MTRAGLLRGLAARSVAACTGGGACAAQGRGGRLHAPLALPPPRVALMSPAAAAPAAGAWPCSSWPHHRLVTAQHHHHRLFFTSLTAAPSSAASAAAAAAAAAAPERAEEAAASPPATTTSCSGGGGGVVVSFPLAQTGEGISECELVRWHVSPGDSVEEFQPLCEVQSDKASVEITSRYAGTIAALHHTEGDVVAVGAPLADIRLANGAPAPPGAAVVLAAVESSAGSSGTAAAQEEGSSGAGGGGGAGGMPPEAVLAPPAVRRLARELGVDLSALAPGSGAGGRLTKEDVQAAAHDAATATSAAEVQQGAVVAKAVAAATPAAAAPAAAAPAVAAPPLTAAPPLAPPPAFERLPIRGYARTMLRTSTEALSVPMFYYFDEVRVDALARLRAELSSSPAAGQKKLTFMPFVVKALSVALAQHPAANAALELPPPTTTAPQSQSQSEQQQQQQQPQPCILRYREHNVGVAMATPAGLVVPVVRNVERKSVAEVAAGLAALQKAAAEGRLPAEALSGGTITVSNIGALGGTHATPLVHPPQAAIVALGRARALPRFGAAAAGGADGGRATSSPPRVESHLMMDVSWGADHRVVDGAELARLSNCWRALLEEPSRLLLHLR